jgi:hypothetical protein
MVFENESCSPGSFLQQLLLSLNTDIAELP